MVIKKIGAFVITITLFALVTVVPHQVGCIVLPDEPENLVLFTRWYLGTAVIILTGLITTLIGVLFGLIYQAVLDFLNDPW